MSKQIRSIALYFAVALTSAFGFVACNDEDSIDKTVVVKGNLYKSVGNMDIRYLADTIASMDSMEFKSFIDDLSEYYRVDIWELSTNTAFLELDSAIIVTPYLTAVLEERVTPGMRDSLDFWQEQILYAQSGDVREEDTIKSILQNAYNFIFQTNINIDEILTESNVLVSSKNIIRDNVSRLFQDFPNLSSLSDDDKVIIFGLAKFCAKATASGDGGIIVSFNTTCQDRCFNDYYAAAVCYAALYTWTIYGCVATIVLSPLYSMICVIYAAYSYYSELENANAICNQCLQDCFSNSHQPNLK